MHYALLMDVYMRGSGKKWGGGGRYVMIYLLPFFCRQFLLVLKLHFVDFGLLFHAEQNVMSTSY